ncbi:hypothetical protein BS78_05G234700 [Paspalum vaginatum]|nr:hypothetical protein BS78_05G234700 [Paspalum vaginatum]
MPNGSLETIINGSQCQWSSRIKIIQGIAEGLCYLHEQRIVHSDLKPSNILLDHNMDPKISDFGIARVLDHGDDLFTLDVNYLAGTIMGYMPPEYIVEGTLSTKYDVYSFGVILIEIIGSMCEHKKFRRQASVEWSWKVRSAEFGSEFFSQSLYHVTELKQIRGCIEVGLLCTQLKPTERPTMADVLEMLNGRRELQNPKKPRYTKKIALPVPDVNTPRLSTSCPARYL